MAISATYLGGFFRTRPPRPMSAVGVCGASPLAAPAGLSLRSAPRRAQRAASAHRASNERATSAELVRTSLARSSRVGRSGVGRPSRGRRSGLAGRSVGGRGSVGLRGRRRPARPSAPTALGVPFARGRTAAGGRYSARASALPRRGRGWGAPSPLLAARGGAPPLTPARGGPRRSARAVRPLSCAECGGGAPSGLPLRPATALGLFRAAPPVLPPRARRARV